jgi:diaminopimelate epimerase
MKKIDFTKMVASGNDFVVTDVQSKNSKVKSLNNLARKICDRKYGVGADGLLVLEKSGVADIRMRIFNADGSEAEMCGNGARCVALWAKSKVIKIETKAGIIDAEVKGESVKIKLTNPKDIKLDIPIRINNRPLKVNFINTGVPHTVIFVEGLDKIDVPNLGRQIRFHGKFAPAGTNVDFAQVLNRSSIKVRTYERGVEDETLACGTGAVASALLYAMRYPLYATRRVNVVTKSGETLKVYFEKVRNKFSDVWLEGKAGIAYKGEYYV